MEGTAGSGCRASSVPYLAADAAAYSAGLPADDDRSSCRLGEEAEKLANRSRPALEWELCHAEDAVADPALLSMEDYL